MPKKITTEVELNFEQTQYSESEQLIKNVLLCGESSKNGYTYPPACFRNDEHVKKLYESVPVYIDHSQNPTGRSVRDLAGVIRNPRMVNGRPYGDIELESSVNCGVDLGKLAQKRLRGLGLSHVAACTMEKGKKAVALVEQVISVDVVMSPATTITFFEQEHEEQMELEQLKAELETVKSENAVLKSDLARLTTECAGHQSESISLLGTLTTLREEVASIKPKLEKFEVAEKLAADKLAVEQQLTEAGLDLSDSLVVSEQFINMLLMVSADKRQALIEDRKAAVAPRGTSNGTVLSRERKQVTTEQFDASTYIASAIKENK